MSNELQVIVQESGLPQAKAQYILDNFQDYFDVAADWEKKAKTISVTSEKQVSEMKMARVGRLFLREKRLAVEESRKKLKEQSLREGKAIDGIANVLKALIIPIEEYLERQEKFVEIKEKEKAEQIRIEVERKMEEERIENERLDKLTDERCKEALPYKQFWSTEKYAFREMSQTNFESVMSDLKKCMADYQKEQERIRLDNDRLKKEAEAKEKALQEERAKVEREKAEAERKARAEQDRLKKEAEAKQKAVEAEAKKQKEADAVEKKRLEELLKNQVECPKCHHKFQLNRSN